MVNTPALILARGGSKRVPRKNVRTFCGRPMVAWVVDAARRSGAFSEVLISTDNQEIAEAAVHAGAVCPALRKESLSNDFAITEDVLRYELERYAVRKGCMPKTCCCLYGTSAFVTPALLCEARNKLADPRIDMVMAVIQYSHPIERALQFVASEELQYRTPEFFVTRTQDLTPSYYDAGLFYWVKPMAFLGRGGGHFLALTRTAVVVDVFSVVDIDTEEDWRLAEQLAKFRFPEHFVE